MNRFSFGWFIGFSLMLILQAFLIDYINIDSIKPDVINILLIYYCLREGQIPGMFAAFFTGLIFDLISAGVLGASSFAKVLAIFICGFFYNENRRELILENYNFLFIVFVIDFISNFVYSMIVLKSDMINFTMLFFKFGLFPAFYTTMLSSVLYLKSPKKLFTYGK